MSISMELLLEWQEKVTILRRFFKMLTEKRLIYISKAIYQLLNP